LRIALLTGGDGWHVRDLVRAAALLGHPTEPVDFRRVRASVTGPPDPLSTFDTGIVRDDVTLAGLTGRGAHRAQGSPTCERLQR